MEDDGTRVEQDEWETWYRDEEVESMPWFLPGLDHDFQKTLMDLGISGGRSVLDLGTGPGTQAIALSRLGYSVTATDISESAVEKAARRSRQEGTSVEFLQDDILHTRLKSRAFALVVDRGCFHTLPPDMRPVYTETVSGCLEPGGYLLLKCFSHQQPGKDGPHRFRPEDIRAVFGQHFEIAEMKDSVFLGNHQPPPRALYSVLRKR